MDNPVKETSNFIGNNNIEEFMLNSINANKLHHAYLLSGIKGLGKATFAYRCTKYILADTLKKNMNCLLYTSPSPRDLSTSRMPSSA